MGGQKTGRLPSCSRRIQSRIQPDVDWWMEVLILSFRRPESTVSHVGSDGSPGCTTRTG